MNLVNFKGIITIHHNLFKNYNLFGIPLNYFNPFFK